MGAESVTIRKPDDWHVHLRDGEMLEAVAPITASQVVRAIVMPNLVPPVTTTEKVEAYRDRVLKATEKYPDFKPLMTYYLTDKSDPDDIERGFKSGVATAVKYYPAGATTNSESGVTNIENVYPVLEKMQEIGMPLLVHGEIVEREDGTVVDPFDREKEFIENKLKPLLKDFPKLKVVLEHITTKDAVDFIREQNSDRLGATITVQHLMFSRTDLLSGGLKPHLFCLPILKRDIHQKSLREAATSGEKFFFLGTDSAPHSKHKKETCVCAAGCFTSLSMLEMYTQVFDEEGKLKNLEAFTSLNGPRFYGLEPNTETVTLIREPWTINQKVPVSNGDEIHPLGYDDDPSKRMEIQWKVK